MSNKEPEKRIEEEWKKGTGKTFPELLHILSRDMLIHATITTVFSILTFVFALMVGDYFLLPIALFSWIGIIGPMGIASKQAVEMNELLTSDDNQELCIRYKGSTLASLTMAVGSIKILGVMNLIVSAYLAYTIFLH